MALAVARAVIDLSRSPSKPAASKATKNPWECPTKWTLSTLAVSNARTSQAAMSSILVRASPSDKLWAGKSGANTL